MKVITLVAVFALIFAANCWSYEGHEMKGDASKAVYDGIKKELLNTVLPTLTNQTLAQQLKSDLQLNDTKKLTVKAIDTISVKEIFTKFGLADPGCDANNDKVVSGDELKCLGKLWKYFVPS